MDSARHLQRSCSAAQAHQLGHRAWTSRTCSGLSGSGCYVHSGWSRSPRSLGALAGGSDGRSRAADRRTAPRTSVHTAPYRLRTFNMYTVNQPPAVLNLVHRTPYTGRTPYSVHTAYTVLNLVLNLVQPIQGKKVQRTAYTVQRTPYSERHTAYAVHVSLQITTKLYLEFTRHNVDRARP